MKNKIKDPESEGTAVKEVESIKEKQNKCSICDYTSSKKSHVKRHLESVHDGKKPHKCSICDYSCAQNSALKKHVEAFVFIFKANNAYLDKRYPKKECMYLYLPQLLSSLDLT